ncbi:hypothetical protein CBR_g865 [Chara braunii]|uniref:ubiquitinyl hydrolase 1 n=1 Tax=Chara braunii TaxID=69332 RepID=A0A388KCJ6_CHABU|nr:hypothetical protein CBR_g865 [Chara braunii]|eukprot:GBG67737.1 hypothetical protein CBR_g865 [Chara braunii]
MVGGEVEGNDGGSGAAAAPSASESGEGSCADENRDRDGNGDDGRVLLYHEPQVSRLCGVHCLNTLLQGPYFTEVDLAAMAEELDRREREVMMESGMESQEYLRFIAEGSGNVAADGDFSIQVLEKALGVWGMRCLPLDVPEASDARLDPQAEQAFICNLQSHWFTIRKVDGEWYNFNSLFPAPEHLSQFYLNAYLGSLQQSGWTIFVVKGEIPNEMGREGGGHDELSGSYGRWMGRSEAARLTKENKNMRDRARRAPVGNDLQLAAALKASMQESNRQEERGGRMTIENEEEDDIDEDLEAAIAASLADALPTASGGGGGGGVSSGGDRSRDPMEIARALAESYQAMVNARAPSGITATCGSSLNASSSDSFTSSPSSCSYVSALSSLVSRRDRGVGEGDEEEGEDRTAGAAAGGGCCGVGEVQAVVAEGGGGGDDEGNRGGDGRGERGVGGTGGRERGGGGGGEQTAVDKAPFRIPEEPAADAEGCLQLALRMPNGARICRRFLADGKFCGVQYLWRNAAGG